MPIPRVVIVDSDYRYLSMLELKFLEELGDGIELESISSAAYLNEYLTQPHDIEALIVSEDAYVEKMGWQNVNHLFILSESRDTEMGRISNAEYVFKYSTTSTVFDRITSVCDGLHARGAEEHETRVLLFYSPVGGGGKTTFAAGIAACLQEAYRRVLYVDAEELQVFPPLFHDPLFASRDLIDAMQTHLQSGLEFADGSIAQGFCDYLPPLRTSLAGNGISLDWYVEFIGYEKSLGKYDYIVVDVDSSLGADKIELLQLADIIPVVVMQTATSFAKVQTLFANLDVTTRSKCRLVCNFYHQDQPNAFDGAEGTLGKAVDMYLSYDAVVPIKDGPELAAYQPLKKYSYALM